MPSLAEMRAQKTAPVPVPKGSEIVTLTEGQHLFDEMDRLKRRQEDLISAAAKKVLDEEQKESKARSRKAAERVEAETTPQLDEIREEIVKVGDRLADHQAEIGLTGMTPGEWKRYKLAHPPRITSHFRTEKDNGDVIIGVPIYDREDIAYGAGVVDVSALEDDLGDFVATWDGAEIAPGEWDDLLRERIIPASRNRLVRKVVLMHEGEVDRVPKLQNGSSGTPSGDTA